MILLIASGKLKTIVPLAGAMLAEATPRFFDEIGIGAAILLTIMGMALHWHLPRHRMSMEERMKDGEMTEDEARRRIRFYAWCAPIATVAGVVVLLAVLFDLAN